MKFSDCGRSSGASRRASSMRLGMVTAGFLKAATRTSSWSSSSSLAISSRQVSTDFSSTASWKAPSAYRRATLLPLGTQFGFLDGFFDQLLVLARVQVLTNDAGREPAGERAPGQPPEHSHHYQKNDQLRHQRRVDGQQAGVEKDHFVIWLSNGFAKIKKSPRPSPMMGSASMNPMPMTIKTNSRPCSSGCRAVPSTVRLDTNPSPMPAPNALNPSSSPKAITVAPRTIALSNSVLP